MNSQTKKDWSITVSTPQPNVIVQPTFAACGSYNSLSAEQDISVFYQLQTANSQMPPVWSPSACVVDKTAKLWEVEISNTALTTTSLLVGLFEGLTREINDTNLRASVTVPISVQPAGGPGTILIVPPIVPPFPPSSAIPRSETVQLSGSYVPLIEGDHVYTLEFVLYGHKDSPEGKILYWHAWNNHYGNHDCSGSLHVDPVNRTWTVNFDRREGFQVLVVRMRHGLGYNPDLHQHTDLIKHTASHVISM